MHDSVMHMQHVIVQHSASSCQRGTLHSRLTLLVHMLKRWHSTDTVQYSTVQYNTVQYSTVQYSTVQYSTVQCSTVQTWQSARKCLHDITILLLLNQVC